MSIDNLKNRIERLKSHIERKQEPEKDRQAGKPLSLKERKAAYYFSSLEGSYNDLKREIFDIVSEAKGQEPVFDILLLWKELQKNKNDADKSREILDRMLAESSKIVLQQKTEAKTKDNVSLKIPKLPEDIKADVLADIREIEKCFNNGLYRSATILCGRVLETALHRKYYEATGNDALEKSPGIGLGNLIAKLKEKSIEIDPAITQQIHLINQVRIFTVHKKKEAFMPSKEQCHAIILYTIDVVGRMF